MHRPPFYQILLSATGITLLTQVVALLRQILMIGYFGLHRELDIFTTVYAMAAVTAFAFNNILDSIFTSQLVQTREDAGTEGAAGASRAYVRFALLLGLIMAAVFAISAPLLKLIFAAGFDVADRERLSWMTLYFLPWIAVSPLYFGAAACLKALLDYRAVFFAEMLLTILSTLLLVAFHDMGVQVAPLAYFGGYAIAVCLLLGRLYRIKPTSGHQGLPLGEIWRRMWAHFVSNQANVPNALVERFWLSFLPPGGISALALVQQLSMNLGGLLAFRDIYLVPLVTDANRSQKMRRLMLGLMHLSLPVTLFVAVFSDAIMTVLFDYGKVTAKDIAATAPLLSVSMLCLLMSVVSTPGWRLQQALGNYKAMTVFYLLSAVGTLIFGALFISILDLGAMGMLLVMMINTGGALLYLLHTYRKSGLHFEPRDGLSLVATLVVSLLAAGVAMVSASFIENKFLSLGVAACAYGVLFLGYAYWRKDMLKELLRGERPVATRSAQ